MSDHDPSKRRFIKTATYVAPAILTLKVMPTFASVGSGKWSNGNPGGSGGEEPVAGDPGAGVEVPATDQAASSNTYTRRKKNRWYWPFS